ncbi:MAG: hypothetical protein K2I70_00235 [Bacilli bacterium]|nr:hypothetical protein [Bacilli bacterium]
MFGLIYDGKKDKSKILSYDDFLMNMDDKSKIRLMELDVEIEAFKSELEREGFEFDECSCIAQDIRILRNQFGFYVDESRALDSKEAYTMYQSGLEFYHEFSKKFNMLHRILREKEYIMNGNYLCKKKIRSDMDYFSASLGYGLSRQKRIYEEIPEHPSMEYQRLVIMLEVINDDASNNKDDIIERCMDKLKGYLLPRYSIEVKRVKDKYGRDFDESCGVLVIDKTLGEMEMVYEFDGLNISKSPYDKYFSHNKPYIDIYLRIITYCLKDELFYDFSDEKGLV